MSEHPTRAASRETMTEQDWSRAPAFTLLGVIVTWYVGTIVIVLMQVL